jgi:SAM-dependent methyltransferase
MVTTMAWRSLAEWQAESEKVLAAQHQSIGTDEPWWVGKCILCQCEVRFASGANLREGMRCHVCGCNARQRAAAAVLLAELEQQPLAQAYATEQASPFYVALRRRLPRLRGSEYLHSWRRRLWKSCWLWRKRVYTWIRHGDMTALRADDASLDAIISLDVLEHVPDHRAALRECARVLKPGGVFVLTVPFHDREAVNQQIARLREDGSIEHVGEPEYHGDPLSGGVLCFHRFGWSLLDDMRHSGFSEVDACRLLHPEAGLPEGVWVLRARR